MILDRRNFLKTAAVAGAAAALAGTSTLDLAADTSAPGAFDFALFTDTHIEPELDAPHGCEMCFEKVAGLRPEFAIMGGDHVYDANAVDEKRAGLVFDLYKKAESRLKMPLYHVIGNHDTFGTAEKGGIAMDDPRFGKKMFEGRVGPTHYSFDHKGYHFVMLDSIQLTPDHMWEARIDDAQMKWLEEDLKKAGPKMPVVAATHVPLVTAFPAYAGERYDPAQKYNTLTVANATEVLRAFEGHNVIAVLQGHLHLNENTIYKGTQFITGGAVCGNWWHGTRMGFPEGFTVVSLRGGKINTRYETYGFQSVDPREKF
jgi:3',5'-cyclic-AMP phosphodiesterase